MSQKEAGVTYEKRGQAEFRHMGTVGGQTRQAKQSFLTSPLPLPIKVLNAPAGFLTFRILPLFL